MDRSLWADGFFVIFASAGDTLDARKLLGPGSPFGAGVAIYLRPAPVEDFPRTPGCHPVDMTGGYWFGESLSRHSLNSYTNVYMEA